MQKLLITGASGLLGTNLAAVARRQGRAVAGVSFQHPATFPGVEPLTADLTDKADVERVVDHVRPAWIIHCAAATSLDWCEDHPAEAHLANVQMTRYLAASARRCGAAFLYVSTDSVFDGERGNYGEQDQPKPVNRYAQTKLEGERASQEEASHCLIARLNLYGWNYRPQVKRNLAEWVIANLEAGRPMPGFQDVIFAPLYVEDLSEILLSMVDRGLSGLYHVASSESCSKYEFAVALANAFGKDASLVKPATLQDGRLRVRRPKNTSLACAKLTAALGMPMPDLVSGILRFKAQRLTANTFGDTYANN